MVFGFRPEGPTLSAQGHALGLIDQRPFLEFLHRRIPMPQSLAMIYIHAIFSTKHRLAFLEKSWREELFHVLGGEANQIGCQSMIVGGVEDHVHILFQLKRTISVAEAIGVIKSTSSSWINENRRTPTHFEWQGGYGAFSVSQSNVEAVKNYILRQPEHYAKQTFQDELREWLARYELTWDERYIWD
jgi:putative transposase